MASASDTYQAPNALECKVCYNVFSGDHCPRILPCTHSYCGSCIDRLISAQKKECPTCREVFSANSAEDLMINRDLLDAAEQLSSLNLRSKTESRETKRSFFESSKNFIKKSTEQSIADCQATEADASDLLKSFSDMRVVFLGANEDIDGFQKTMEELKLSNESKVGDIDQCVDLLGNKLQGMLQGVEDIKVFDAKVTSVADFASNGLLLDETGAIVDDVQGKMMELQDLIQKNNRDRDNFLKEILQMRGRFRNLADNIEERIQADSRGIFVVMTFEGAQRVAPVKIESNNQVSVSHLEEGVLPPRCFVIELESLIPGGGSPSPPLSPPPPRGFLDLAYGPTPLGRVIIRVTVDGLKGRNFLLMCAGGMEGASYAHSRVSYVGNKGGAGERIVMGEYQPHGGGGGGGGTTSTRAVLPSREEDWKRERESGTYEETPRKAGDVRGNIISYEGASKFWIVTRDGDPSERDRSCFGMVEEGLDVLKSAISKYEDIKQVEVANCGLIL